MTRLAPLTFVALLLTAGTAAAQRETLPSRDVAGMGTDRPRRSADLELRVAPRGQLALADEDELALTPPSAGDYVLPVLGIVLGSVMTIGGAGTALVTLLAGAIASGFGNDHAADTAFLIAGLAGGGAVLGVIFLVAGAVATSGLNRRAREAEAFTVAVAPLEGGALVVGGGRF